MKVIVHGLGIIGGSIAASLKAAGHTVYGKNRSRSAIDYALEHGYIDGVAEDYAGADVVFLALPPRITVRELQEGSFPAGCIVADICGVKQPISRAVHSAPRAYRYVGTHPMAGKETSGIASASATLFSRANFVITRENDSDEEALSVIRSLARDMGFARIEECSAQKHDEMIALTSQLAHVVSSAYIKREGVRDCAGFTGGSFQDMTRVAVVDEKMWAELYLFNQEYLLNEVDRMIGCLQAYRTALSEGDEEGLRALVREGRCYR